MIPEAPLIVADPKAFFPIRYIMRKTGRGWWTIKPRIPAATYQDANGNPLYSLAQVETIVYVFRQYPGKLPRAVYGTRNREEMYRAIEAEWYRDFEPPQNRKAG